MPSPLTSTALAKGRSWSRQQKRFVQAAGSTSHGLGLGRLVGRIYGLLLLEPLPMCLDDIVARLAISKASASITLRRLAAWKLVQRSVTDKDRRDYYRVEGDFFKVLREGLVPMASSKLSSASQMLEVMLDSVRELPTEAAEVQRRLEKVKSLQEKFSMILQSGLLDRLSQ